YDIKNRRLFLKRSKVGGIEKGDIYVGNTIKIFSRPFLITDYANAHTMRIMETKTQKTCGIIKPEAMAKKSEIIRRLMEEGFKLCQLRMMKLNNKVAGEFFSGYRDSREYPAMVKSLTKGPVLAMELLGNAGISRLLEVAGPEEPEEARRSAPNSLRALYGIDKVNNAFYATPSGSNPIQAGVLFETDWTNGNYNPCTAVFNNSVLCIVKPHAVKDGLLGKIMVSIEENGYTITAMKLVHMDIINTEEFYEVYRDVLPEYSGMVTELISGPCVAMEITSPLGEMTAVQFRKFVGPLDPDIAKQLRPNTLRALYGTNKLQNGVHVTDLPEDRLLEVSINI
ncbi:hypothetical protein AAG570_002222, partial [Ranatra chinensis]